MASGVFGLRKVYKKQVQNVTDNNFANWPEGATYGYYAGGSTPSYIDTITRLDFANETVSDPGNNLPTVRIYLAATSSSSYGYFGGGRTPSDTCTITRLDFSSETLSDPGNNLPTARYGLGATSDSSYSYFGGGLFSPLTYICLVTRLDFSNETVSNPGNNLPTSRAYLGATSNSSYGYFGGGFSPPYINTISRLEFVNGTVSNPGNNLPATRGFLEATSSNSYGYYAGGRNPTKSDIFRLDFSNETVSDTGNLPSVRSSFAASSSNSYGYFGGGFTPAVIDTITRLDFPNETVSNPGNNLPSARYALAALSGGASVSRANGYGTYGYTIGGWGPPAICNITRQDFSSNTFSDVGTIPLSLYGNDRSAYNNEYGYFGGGYASPARRSRIYRLDFSNESVRTLSNTLPEITDGISQTSTTEVGYFGGGYSYQFSPPVPATWHSKICKLDFSSESVSTLPASGRLSAQKGGSSAARTPQYAFFAGGSNLVGPAQFSKIDRMDFSTEVNSTYTNMGRVRVDHTSIENNIHGYFWGGSGPPNTNDADKFQFSNGTITNLPGIVGSNPYYYSQNSQTDSYYGYFIGGGWQPYPFAGSFGETLVRRLDFSSDTVALLPPYIPGKAGKSASMSNKY